MEVENKTSRQLARCMHACPPPLSQGFDAPDPPSAPAPCLCPARSYPSRPTSNNLKLKKKAEAEARDQGFTRCKVLIVLPCRNAAWHLIKTLLALAPGAQAPKGRVDNLGRFREEFGPGDQEDRRADRERLGKTGEDHWERFEGNNEDHFRIGIQLHSKYARLFAPFYSADIIVASPLGLRMIVKSAEEKSRETDFLSSVDMVILDQFDYLMMQVLPACAVLACGRLASAMLCIARMGSRGAGAVAGAGEARGCWRMTDEGRAVLRWSGSRQNHSRPLHSLTE